MKKRFDIVGIGCSAADYLGVTPTYPGLDVKQRLDEFTMQGGGLVATALVAASRLGASTHFIGKVGDDTFGRFILEEFEREGVCTEGCIVAPGMSARFAFIAIDRPTGKRTIFWTDDRVPIMDASDVTPEQVAAARYLHVDGYEAAAAIQAGRYAAEDSSVTMVLDAENTDPESDELLDLADVIIASESFGLDKTDADNFEDAARQLHTRLAADNPDKIVVVTAGLRGCYCIGPASEFHQPAFDVEAKDTTGCGDVFHGAFIVGLLEGWPLQRVAEFASAVAAVKTRKLGGRAGIPNRREVEDFLAKQGKEHS